MNDELKSFKYLFDDSRIDFIDQNGTFFKRPTQAQAKDWHRKMVTLYSGDEEEIDMMDEFLLNPKFANPYLSLMYIEVLVQKVKHCDTTKAFRDRAYKSIVGNTEVCGEMGTRSVILNLGILFKDDANYYWFNDLGLVSNSVLDILANKSKIRKNCKKEIENYFMAKKLAKLYMENKDILNENNTLGDLEK